MLSSAAVPRPLPDDVELTAGGLRLAGSTLWLDAERRRDLSFVSHAHRGSAFAHRRIIATEATVRLLRLRLKSRLPGALSTAYRRPFAVGRLTLELYPAGCALGSAQICATCGGRRIAYAGDLGLGPSLTAEPAQVVSCDALVLAGWPTAAATAPGELAEVDRFVDRILARGGTPIVICSRAAKCLEIIKHLADRGRAVRAREGLWRQALIHEQLGLVLPGAGPLLGAPRPGEVVVALPPVRRPSWWLESSTHDQLLLAPPQPAAGAEVTGYVRATRAGRVYTAGPAARELARALESAGVRARALIAPQQLALV